MSDRTSFDVTIYSPRWGTEDIYTVQLERSKMRFGRNTEMNPSVCTWIEGRDPTWSAELKI